MKPTIDSLISTYKTSGIIHAIPVNEKSQYRLFFSASNVTTANSPGINMCFTKHEGQTAIEFFNIKGFQAACGDSGRINNNTDELVVHGCQNGYIFKQEYGNSLNGASNYAFMKFPYYVFDDPAVRKTIYTFRAYVKVVDSGLANLYLQVNLDDNDAGVLQPPVISLNTAIPQSSFLFGYNPFGVAVFGAGLSYNYRTSPVGAGYNLGWTLYSNDTSNVWNVRTLIVEYEMSGRD